MPSETRVMTGARAILSVGGEKMGVFNNFSYGQQFDVEHAYILGRFNPDEIVYTAMGPVACQASGWRVIDQGPHIQGKVPHLQDLLTHDYITLTVVDRQSGKTVAQISSVRPTGYTTQVSSRQAEEISVSFTGLIVQDESGEQADTLNSMHLPPGAPLGQ